MKAHNIALVSLALAGAALLTAQSDSKGKQVIDQAIAALGGERFLHMQNRAARGRVYSFFHDQLSGLDVATIYTEYVMPRPEKGIALREREVLGKKRDYSYSHPIFQSAQIVANVQISGRLHSGKDSCFH
jgi:hypothetical protein